MFVGYFEGLSSERAIAWKCADSLSLREFLGIVQVQSTWFPIYDRNPQTFVPNIFWAKPGDYKAAVQRIYHSPDQPSFIDLPLAVTP